MSELTFGRKINYVPLTVSVAVGLVIGLFFYTFAKQVGVSILFGILSFVVAIALYTVGLSNTYGYWKIDGYVINYYNYQTLWYRISAILFPFHRRMSVVDLSKIERANLVVGKKMQVPANIKAAPASAYLVYFYPSSYFLSLVLTNRSEINLDLSFDEMDEKKIDDMIRMVNYYLDEPITFFEQ